MIHAPGAPDNRFDILPCLSLLVLVLLNLPPEGQARELIEHYFAASHLVVALWAGYGLILFGTIMTRKKRVGHCQFVLFIRHDLRSTGDQ